MDRTLRGSAAHVLVTDLDAPDASPEAMHHLLRVLRLKEGEVVTITDGKGSWRVCVLVARLSISPATFRWPSAETRRSRSR